MITVRIEIDSDNNQSGALSQHRFDIENVEESYGVLGAVIASTVKGVEGLLAGGRSDLFEALTQYLDDDLSWDEEYLVDRGFSVTVVDSNGTKEYVKANGRNRLSILDSGEDGYRWFINGTEILDTEGTLVYEQDLSALLRILGLK